VDAILYLRDAKEYIARWTLRDSALGISQREKIGDLNASDGLLSKFMERNNFSFRQFMPSPRIGLVICRLMIFDFYLVLC